MLKVLFCALLLTPAFAHAADECRYQAPRNGTLDLAGVRTIQVDIGRHTLHLIGSQTGGVKITGRACASSAAILASLRFTQRREGDRLILTATDGLTTRTIFKLFEYAYLDLRVAVPSNLPVELNVGSGDADVVGIARLSANTGSGDVHVHGIGSRLDANVGSGDIDAADVGEIHVGAIGSGDFKADRVRGDVRIASIGSGDATLRTIGGSVDVGTVGSGDLHVDGIAHDLRVHSVGSGDVEHKGVVGRVDVPKDD